MKLALLLTAGCTAATCHLQARKQGSQTEWHPAGPGDLRGPCPMMNTLANHGFLPHDGKNLTKPVVMKGLQDGLNFNEALIETMFEQALIANPEPNATWFDLGLLNRHNVLEHDASLSRTDAFFGNNHIFNQSVFDETTKYWHDPILNASMLGNSKIARQLQSKSTNPEYTFTNTTEAFSIGEVLAPIIAFGDIETATVNRSLVIYFFENERLPTEMGWCKRTEPVALKDILKLHKIIGKASRLITGTEGSSEGDLHSPPPKGEV
ncbi:uncharacterized protein LTR77_009393 [Saxophila tyrrhenica]|uniref:Heme haloperoxidase family profile domain-containing protein n=1 Tax=Saxophila tyrrhenica TaxID=1690608 RepID=A0AAV9NZK5_9PEZI|nr:hypothetical protein LTR77_009393 [Saxophila tyrrhenica]